MNVKSKKKVFYWSPCLNKVGTVISTKNSAIALAKYKKDIYNVSVINVCGEWNEYIEQFKKNGVNVINLTFNYHSYLPKTGFLKSRFSYILIFIISILPLILCLKKQKPNFIISHLITSLPLFIMRLFKFETKFILRISGFPKLNVFRRFFWKGSSKKLYKITCPTKELLQKIKHENIFNEDKICFLQDAIINLDNYKRNNNFDLNLKNLQKKIILSAGRLTKQKNYKYLIKEYSKFLNNCDDYDLVILGEGEEREEISSLIEKLNLSERVHLVGRVENVYDYMQNSDVFVLSSLWEELGFVIVEAAFKNLFIVSSNCPNGPKEFIDNNSCGILFENNEFESLKDALINFNNLKNTDMIKKKVNAKKKSHNYSKFRHHTKLCKILNYENQV